MKKRALVTGANGFIGSHLLARLLAEGWEVHSIVRPGSNLVPLGAMQDDLLLHVHDGTTANMQTIMSTARPKLVFHLASMFLAEHQPTDVEGLIQSNLLFGTQLAEAMVREGALWMVNAGTVWQHYENQVYSPVNLYAATKQAFEALLQYYVEASGLCVITLKLSDTYGPDDPRPKLMNLLKRLAADNQPLAMSPGEQFIDLVHVDDVVRAFVVAGEQLLSGAVKGHERYAVSSSQPLRLRELVHRYVEQVLGRKLHISWGARPYREREVMKPWIGEPLPGWIARVQLAEGLESMFSNVGHDSPSRHMNSGRDQKTS